MIGKLEWISNVVASWSPLAVFLRLLLAMIIGIVIGIDREMKHRSAGVRTHVLVCLGAAMAMILSEYMMHKFAPSPGDLYRNGAAVISGIGFIGAGTIITTRSNQVRGLTTAAGLWGCACLGLSAGIGYLWGTAAALFLFLFAQKALVYMDHWLAKYSKVLTVYLEFETNRDIRHLMEELREGGAFVSDLNLVRSMIKGDGPVATVTVQLPSFRDREKIMAILRTCSGISFYEIL
jgi:putative Mg2+ transporter-C (MgtC) family protein